jgi:uncharacterized protein YcbX
MSHNNTESTELKRPRLKTLCRYPVKGLNAEFISEAILTQNKGIPFDRYFAIAHGETNFDANNPQHLDKKYFLMQMKNTELAQLNCEFDEIKGLLQLSKDRQVLLKANLNSSTGRSEINQFFGEFLSSSVKSTPKIVSSEGHMFADIATQNLSLINLNSVKDFEQRSGLTIDPMRFRANVYIDDLPAWQEFDLLQRDFSIGDVKFQGSKKTVRCAATMVDPQTAKRDINVPLTLRKIYGHIHMGIYIDVVSNGVIRVQHELIV